MKEQIENNLQDNSPKIEPMPIPKQKSFGKDLLENIVTMLIMGLMLFLILNYVGQRVSVDGPSMMTTLNDRDQLWCNKFVYKFRHEPERYDIVIFLESVKPRTYYIKRVIGLPGETVQIIDSVIYINGEAIEDPYPDTHYFSPGRAAEPITLGDDEYFVLGDNRNNSTDSRSYSVGNVSGSAIVGKAVFRAWPLRDAGSLKGK